MNMFNWTENLITDGELNIFLTDGELNIFLKRNFLMWNIK